jgi:hypothetical protein
MTPLCCPFISTNIPGVAVEIRQIQLNRTDHLGIQVGYSLYRNNE